ncbi:MAG: hypothetical protein MJA29_01530, partial [Candidatus Omnitrophica bacterium]|nr:hypothetical protein [Candidatus Omnitrophota bacterium]
TRVLRRPAHPQYYPDIFTSKFRYDLEKIRQERIDSAAQLIQRTIRKERQKLLKKGSFLRRKRARELQAVKDRLDKHQFELKTGTKQRETLAKVLAFRHRMSHWFPGASYALDIKSGYMSTSKQMAQQRPFTMTPTGGPRYGKARTPKEVTPRSVQPHVPLPTWQDYLGAPKGREKDWTWEDNWKKKPPGQRRALTRKFTKAQMKAQSQKDYLAKLKDYVRQAHAERFIVMVDKNGKSVPFDLADIQKISLRDLK